MSQEYRPAPPPTTRPPRYLAAAWLALSLAALGFVLYFGRNWPWADEWEFIPALAGHEPFWPWLWRQHNEHRLPLPRLLYWALYQLTGDFRAGMAAQVALISGLAWHLMAWVRRRRGRADWADLLIPAGLLHPGHAENWLMGYQVCFALVCGLACELVVLLDPRTPLSPLHRGVLAGLTLIALELCGGAGLVFAPPVAAWLLCSAAMQWRPIDNNAVMAIACVAIAYLAVYFQGYERPPHHPQTRPSDWRLVLTIAGEVVGEAFGHGVAPATWRVGCVLVLALAQLAAWRMWRLGGAGYGSLAALAGLVGLALAVGWGRAGFGDAEMGLWARYAWLSWPLLFAAYAATPVDAVRRGLALAVLAAFPFNVAAGVGYGRDLSAGLDAQMADHAAGVPAGELVRRHLEGSGQEERAERGLPMLKR